MIIKHLQLNTSVLRSPEKVAEFVEKNDTTIACLQEIAYPINGENPLVELLAKQNLHYIDGVHFHYLPKNQNIGVGIVSKFPVIDYLRFYYNTDTYLPKEISVDNLIDDVPDNFPASRGLRNSIKSRCILVCLLQTPVGLVRVITTHYTVSDLCSETGQMFEMSKIIRSLIKSSNDIPTIFSTDMNVRFHSYSGYTLAEVMECHTKDFTDTLTSNHKAKVRDFPEGLAIDHVFSRGLKHMSSEAIEIDFSEHKAVVSEFEL